MHLFLFGGRGRLPVKTKTFLSISPMASMDEVRCAAFPLLSLVLLLAATAMMTRIAANSLKQRTC